MKTIAEYLLMVTSQYQNSPKYLEWLSIPLQVCNDIHTCANKMPDQFDLDNAKGVQLDILGQYLGQGRTLPFDPTDGSSPSMDDAIYRKILKLKTMTNYWNGSLHSIYYAWGLIFTESSIKIDDQKNMSAIITLSGTMSQLVKDMIYNDLVLPRPEGVEYIYDTAVVPDTAAAFAYDYSDDESDYFKGYDLGWWDAAFV